ncbi:hypothetical protein KKA95_03045, partial [Patescibacteria group bacterium]|nr:hypothetical protein [Patescibacteria group bacterium]
SALAMLSCYGMEVMITNNVVPPSYQVREFEDILEDIAQKEKPYLFTHLKHQYQDIADELNELSARILMHGDTKPDNIKSGHLIDLEALKIGDPAISISLYLVDSGIEQEQWSRYVQTYMDVVQHEIGREYTPEELVELTGFVKKVALLPALKELSGLYSRPMGEKEEKQALTIRRFLRSA